VLKLHRLLFPSPIGCLNGRETLSGNLDAVTYFTYNAQELLRMLLLGSVGFALPSGGRKKN